MYLQSRPIVKRSRKESILPKRGKNSQPTETEATGGVAAVDRALNILRSFREKDRLTLTEIATRTGYYRSTILRLAISLEAAGFLVRHADKSYALGAEIIRLGAICLRTFRLEDYVRPVLSTLRELTGESVSLFRREGDRRLCLFREDSQRSVRDTIREGDLLSMEAGAAAHVLRHFDGDDWLIPAEYPEANLPFLSFGERDPDVAAAAVPVFSARDGLIGALTVSGPVTRFTPEMIAGMKPHLVEAGRDLSTALGWHCPVRQ